MTANARTIRAERYAEIGTLIQRDSTLLIERWARRAVEEQAKASRVHHEVLLDHLPTFLWELGNHLAASNDGEPHSHCRSASQHGEQRWESGWSLAEVVRDYRILRLVILEHLDHSLDRPLRLREMQGVGLALDDAIEASIERYVRSRDEQLRQVEESLRQRAEALKEADRRKNEFLAVLAHELRNPLAPLRNALEVLRLDGDSPATIRRVREMMDRQVGQMTRLVEDLLDVARISQGKLTLRKERLDLRQVVEQAAQTNLPLRQTREHHFESSLPDEPLWIDGDQTRLVQVVVNLLNNAAKYTPERGTIVAAATREEGDLVLRVKDNGIGIPAEKLAHIFDLFAQLDLGPANTMGGLGIGLTLVRRLVELHGGSIAAISAGAGQGSEFVVRLPAAPRGASHESPNRAPPTARKRHVLIVEDNADGRESLAVLLRLLGHRVDVAADGQHGIETALAARPEVALIDIGLPLIDGYEVARRLRAAMGPSIFLVALTGHSQPEDRQKALKAGFDTHLTKPVELEALQTLLA